VHLPILILLVVSINITLPSRPSDTRHTTTAIKIKGANRYVILLRFLKWQKISCLILCQVRTDGTGQISSSNIQISQQRGHTNSQDRVAVATTFFFTVAPNIYWSKGKGKMSPYNRPRRPRGGVEVLLYFFLNFGPRWMWVVNATTRSLYHRKRPGTHCIGGWVGPRAGLDRCGKSRPHRGTIPGQSSP
jgi:hypothetical protein